MVQACLKRIGLKDFPEKNEEGLRELMDAVSRHIPFENADVHLGRKVNLETQAIIQKIVEHKRGGYCYEINGILSYLLNQWGLKVSYLGARSIMGYQSLRPITHMLLKVEIDKQSYLCDLGYTGLNPSYPLSLDSPDSINKGFRLIKIEENPGLTLQKRKDNKQWLSLYSFEKLAMNPIDFEPANYFNNYSKDSICTKQFLCYIGNASRSIRLRNRQLTIMEDGKKKERIIESQEELKRTLQDHFHLNFKPWEIEVLFCQSARREAADTSQSCRT